MPDPVKGSFMKTVELTPATKAAAAFQRLEDLRAEQRQKTAELEQLANRMNIALARSGSAGARLWSTVSKEPKTLLERMAGSMVTDSAPTDGQVVELVPDCIESYWPAYRAAKLRLVELDREIDSAVTEYAQWRDPGFISQRQKIEAAKRYLPARGKALDAVKQAGAAFLAACRELEAFNGKLAAQGGDPYAPPFAQGSFPGAAVDAIEAWTRELDATGFVTPE
jgi:hypothetical protein